MMVQWFIVHVQSIKGNGMMIEHFIQNILI